MKQSTANDRLDVTFTITRNTDNTLSQTDRQWKWQWQCLMFSQWTTEHQRLTCVTRSTAARCETAQY